jgi:hypothetical protein
LVPYHFEYDSTDKILMVRFDGSVAIELIQDFYRAATALIELTDMRGSVVDFSRVVAFEVSVDEIRELAMWPPADPVTARPRVVVAPMDRVFGLVRMFGIWGEGTRPNFHVVRTFREAYAILRVVNPRFFPRE